MLDLFGTPYDGKEVSPLLVAEGYPDDKLHSIDGSGYLVFAYSQLTSHEGSLCIFGHRLGDADKHIAEAVKRAGVHKIGVSIKPTASRSQVISEKARFQGLFPNAELRFFDSSTHPLVTKESKSSQNG